MADFWHLLAHSPSTFILVLGLLGLLIGSFLNVVIHRLPLMMERGWRDECAAIVGSPPVEHEPPFSLSTPRSRCPHCEHPIAAWDNIPILSWLLLGGRCRHCRSGIAYRYPLIELVAGASSAIVAWHFGFSAAALLAAGMSWALIALSMIDLDTQLLPDDINQPLLWAGLAANLLGTFVNLQEAVIGAMVGYLSLWCVFHAFRLATGKEGMGQGDFKLLAALGAWLGWQALPIIVVISAFVGALVGLALIGLGRHDRAQPMPFGPFLAVAGWMYLVWGGQLRQFLFVIAQP
jgi:leader peptidase (prepilin peptidase)/N-methyltransferase